MQTWWLTVSEQRTTMMYNLRNLVDATELLTAAKRAQIECAMYPSVPWDNH